MFNGPFHPTPLEMNECYEDIDVYIMGRLVGTADDFDDVDYLTTMFMGFEPIEGLDLPSGGIIFNFETGRIESYDERGVTTFSVDLLSTISHLPVEPDLADFGGNDEPCH